MIMFYNVNSIKVVVQGSAFFDRPEYSMSAICLAKLWKLLTASVRGLYDK